MPSAQKLFDTVPSKDVLGFYRKGVPQYKKPVEFLNFKKNEIALAADTPVNSIRYDGKMPEELRQRIMEWAMAINLVASFFGDMDKTRLWFQIPNPQLGNISPKDMIKLGRFKKLNKFILSALQDNMQ